MRRVVVCVQINGRCIPRDNVVPKDLSWVQHTISCVTWPSTCFLVAGGAGFSCLKRHQSGSARIHNSGDGVMFQWTSFLCQTPQIKLGSHVEPRSPGPKYTSEHTTGRGWIMLGSACFTVGASRAASLITSGLS